MIFNSLTFLIFLVAVTTLYWVSPRRPRLFLLFLASIAFYGFWRLDFVALMLVSSTTDYLVSLALFRSTSQVKRRVLLGISLAINLSLLFFFKYLLFFTENVWFVLQMIGVDSTPPELNIILPLGISFYTFQTISYTVDVYRGFLKPERDYVSYSVYVMFFPQLVAGPILRASEVLPQLSERPKFQVEFLVQGVQRILCGLFLKVVCADNIAPLVDAGFAMPAETLSALDVWTLAFLFGYQIYFDFSAYSHIAIGSAALMGVTFPENFNFPYFAVSPRDFWKRWHISLSSWIRDYLYLPLAGVKVQDRSTGGLAAVDRKEVSSGRWLAALFLTWAIMGFWHGAAWQFLIWGVWHATLIQVYRISAGIRQRLSGSVRQMGGWCFTLGLVMLGWVPFRAAGLADALVMMSRTLQPQQYFVLGLRENTYLVAALMLLAMTAVYGIRQYTIPIRSRHPELFVLPDSLVYGAAFGLVFVFLRPVEQFIYFQF